MRHLFLLFLIISCLLTFLPGCEPKEDLLQTSGRLEFSADTVLFDTVFTTVKTVTKRLWVYNRNGGAVKTNISLAGAADATFSLVINGDAGPATSATIRGQDSLLVLVRAVLGDNGSAAKPFLLVDQLRFSTNGNEQDVKLVAYGQNAYFHRADFISSNTTWATDKPHVIINTDVVQGSTTFSVGVQVNPNATLRIPKGARVYCHAGATLVVAGTLLVNDTYTPPSGLTDTIKADNREIVRFQGDRLEPFYADVPGQWAGIIFTETSRGNVIRYAEIKNANAGVFLLNPENRTPRPDIVLENTVIRNISGSNPSYVNNISLPGGIVSLSGDVKATNCLITNCGEYAVLGVGGGIYDFNFCTFANYTPTFRRETSSLTFTNEKATDPTIKLPLILNLRNSILWGSNLGPSGIDDELFVKNYAEYTSLDIRNTLLRTKEYATISAVVGSPSDNLLNVDPLFKRTPASGFGRPDYSLQATSPAISPKRTKSGTAPAADILNLRRSATDPSLGAYESK
ncbi:hypothetical protein I2I05_01960 [Hymenobacter sp. BT683]|uniref:Right-handed parallel beta-helix repeat-containing protein n=1 Tax=Hymenobacter jeongseonensis TaxID=2791027 RepID=A0ABS0IDM6_9BACT|nr:hypothetical protein [Hymenobacter jeongseonensis]MBF9236149.1 hypothetical protein [Hymenobacter jeongseonensis]